MPLKENGREVVRRQTIAPVMNIYTSEQSSKSKLYTCVDPIVRIEINLLGELMEH